MTQELLIGGDLSVKRLGFGAMRLARDGWAGAARDPEAGRAVLRRAVELGVNHLDTATLYRSPDGAVSANQLIREALYPYPSDLVIATKVGPAFGPRGVVEAPASRLRELVEDNLRSLNLDRLELVYLRLGNNLEIPHGASLGERFEALAQLREEGLIRHLGISHVDAQHLAEARRIAPVTAVQNSFSLGERGAAGLLEACEQSGIAFVAYSPLGGGYSKLDPARLAPVAARHHATTSQIALAWLLRCSPVTLAIPGTGSLAHLEENLRAGSLQLGPEDLRELAGSQPQLG